MLSDDRVADAKREYDEAMARHIDEYRVSCRGEITRWSRRMDGFIYACLLIALLCFAAAFAL